LIALICIGFTYLAEILFDMDHLIRIGANNRQVGIIGHSKESSSSLSSNEVNVLPFANISAPPLHVYVSAFKKKSDIPHYSNIAGLSRRAALDSSPGKRKRIRDKRKSQNKKEMA
jgi:hypothetical protein